MDLFKIEAYRRSLVEMLNSDTSVNQKIYLLNDFFGLLLSSGDEIIIKGYLPEFIDDYTLLLDYFSPLYKEPSYSRSLIDNLQLLIDSGYTPNINLQVKKEKLLKELTDFEKLLSGDSHSVPAGKKVSFPVVENFNHIGGHKIFSILEYVRVDIFDSHEDIFVIVPSEKEIDKRLSSQIKISWEIAVNSARQYSRSIKEHHKVIIQFENRFGFYIGDSLGTALSVVFIKELLTFYNSPYLIGLNESIAVTGGIDENGIMIPVSDLIIERKVETVFYSPVNIFIVPEPDFTQAEKALTLLEERYPLRNKLKLMRSRDINDLFDRRSIIEIRKQNTFVRSGKYLRKYWATAALLLILAAALGSVIFADRDDNPAMYSHQGNIIKILNKNGKILWTAASRLNSEELFIDIDRKKVRIIDIDRDGTNEVLITSLVRDDEEDYHLYCYDNQKSVKWKYTFTDIISTELEDHSRTFQISIIDTLMCNGRTELYLIARNIPFYPAAIFKLDLLTGERIDSSDIFWHPGNFSNALMDDFNNDGIKEIAVTAMSNCFERGAFFTINSNILKGQAPAEGNYIFKDIPPADLNSYLLLPKSDMCTFNNLRYPTPVGFSFDYTKKEFSFTSVEGEDAGLLYFFSPDLKINKVNCGDGYQFLRDNLVKNGILPLPYTNTKEYFDMLQNGVTYWNGKTFTTEYFSAKRKEGGTN